MAHLSFTPQLVADALAVVFFVVEALHGRRGRLLARHTGGGTTPVFWGCYLVTLLALNVPAPAPVTAEPPVGWIGVIAAAGGLARIVATLAATCSAGARPGDTVRLPDSRGNLVFWIGAAAASLNVIAMLTVAVAMLAATGVRRSAETARSGQPAASSRAFHGSGE